MIDFDTHDLNRKISEENFAILPLKLPPITSFLHFRLFEAMKNNSWLVFFLLFKLSALLAVQFMVWKIIEGSSETDKAGCLHISTFNSALNCNIFGVVVFAFLHLTQPWQ